MRPHHQNSLCGAGKRVLQGVDDRLSHQLASGQDLIGRHETIRGQVLDKRRILLGAAESGEVIGLLVDEVKHVVRLAANEIEPAATALGGDISEFVLGIGRPAGEFLILLDLPSVVAG